MALRELSEVMPEPASVLAEDQALLDQLLNYEPGGAETGGGEEGFDLGATDAPAADQEETYVVEEGDTSLKFLRILVFPWKILPSKIKSQM